jgi:hypothetical protein
LKAARGTSNAEDRFLISGRWLPAAGPGARIVLNPQHVARPSNIKIIPNVARSSTRCELGQLALRPERGLFPGQAEVRPAAM